MNLVKKLFPKKRVFLDFASTTPVSPEVLGAMRQVQNIFQNPSALYTEAILAKEKIVEAKKTISDILNCQKEDLVFTSGGTESNNLALLGVFEKYKIKDFTPHFVVTDFEHPAVLEVCKEIERRGGEITYVGVQENGVVNVRDIEKEIKKNTVLVSVMYANNEIGTIQPIKEIGRMIKEYRRKEGKSLPYFHSDACQAGLYLSLDVLKLNLDMMTLDGIKMYGPRGTGVLFKKKNVELHPIFFGGGQQLGLRSGTENLPGIVGMAKCLEVAEKMKEYESKRLGEIRDYAIDQILSKFPGASLNGDRENRLPNNINICFPGIDAEFITIALDVRGFCVSYSSSCRTLKEDSSSYVVEAIGKKDCSLSSLRFSLGRESKKGDVDGLCINLENIIN